MAPDRNRVVFVGNIPYGVSEDILQETLSRVGQVVNFRLVHDKDSGKPKGFGFAEYTDPDSAASAVRNLNDTEIMGRKLRVDWSNDGGGAPNEGNAHGAQTNVQPRVNGQDSQQAQQSSALPQLPSGLDLPPGLTCPDAISQTLRALSPPQLLDILSQMKGLVTTNPAQAAELFRSQPQVAYAMFQALLLLGLIDTSVLSSILEQATDQSAPQAAAPQPPPPAPFPAAPQPSYHQAYPPVGQPYMPTPPTMGQYHPPQPPPQPAAPPAMDTTLIGQVLSMPQSTIDALPPEQREQLMLLKQQFMSQGY